MAIDRGKSRVAQPHQRIGAGVIQRYYGAYALDQAASTAIYLVLAWVAVHVENADARAIGIIALPPIAKVIFGATVGGALSDRWGSIRVARVTVMLRALLLVGLIVTIGQNSVVGLLAFGVVYGIVDGTHEPAIKAISTDLVAGSQRKIQGTLDTVGRVGRLSAGPAAGALIGITSAATAVWMIVAALGLSWCLLPPLEANPRRDAEAPGLAGFWRSSVVGWKTVAGHREVRFILVIFAIANVTLTPPIGAGLALLTELRGWPALALGLLSAAYNGGSLLGSLYVARRGNEVPHPRRAALWSLLPTAVCVAALAWVGWWPIAVALSLVGGVSSGFGPSLLGGLLKDATPDGQQGRVQGVLTSVNVGAGPLGFGVLALLSTLAGAQVAITVFAGVLLVAVTFLLGRIPA